MSTDSNDRKLMVLGWLFHLGGLVTLVLAACAYQFVISGLITRQESDNAEEIESLEILLETERDTSVSSLILKQNSLGWKRVPKRHDNAFRKRRRNRSSWHRFQRPPATRG